MSSVILTGDTSGTLTLSAPLVAGSNTVTLPAATGTVSLLTQATSVSASGTSVDFTGIPSWAKRITVMLAGVSTSGTSNILIQIGDSGGIEDAGYLSTSDASGVIANSTSGFVIRTASASNVMSGHMILTPINGNLWISSSVLKQNTTVVMAGGGDKTLSDTLTQVRITTANGTDTFDAGTINIMYEG